MSVTQDARTLTTYGFESSPSTDKEEREEQSSHRPVRRRSMKTLHWIGLYAALHAVIHTFFVVLRFSTTGVDSYRVKRAHTLAWAELGMLFGSFILFGRLSQAFANLFLPNSRAENGSLSFLPLGNRWRHICLSDIWRALVFLFLVLAHVSFLFYYIWLSEEPNLLSLISLWAMGLYLHLLVLSIVFEVLYYLVKFIENRRGEESFKLTKLTPMTRDQITVSILALSFVLACGGLFTALSDPVVQTEQIFSKHLPSSMGHPVKIALLTDIHIGPSIGKTRIEKVVKMTNEINPDVVAIAGDLADGFVSDLREAAAPLCNLKTKYGVYFATGNHEYMHGNVDEWFAFLRSCNITVLHNENRHIALPQNASLCMAGMDDLETLKLHIPGHGMDPEKALRGCRPGELQVLLAHQPNAAKRVIRDGLATHLDLILSGHTHNGQMYVFWPIVWAVNAYKRGLYYDAPTDTQIYVSAGVNFFGPPIKMMGNCEIIDLQIFPRH
ncbi:hypothetical protein PFISCL1PPCAC_27288 [Pristionchus fissidentatus]|uniref:Calcineurin-like phosphoesterase domain-containing protein n=1 Tax=Pristionchus fissidentatus TaxID=1538716 RepID=A0AAV5WXW3_9BILA|nr:hypothetical protein PFISCL1PPCAC_27288 [Pristionchus fissidentatus]